jgi:hypothetical protein
MTGDLASSTSWQMPPPDECEEDEFYVDFDRHRVHQRLRTWRGQLVEFSVVLQVHTPGGGWVTVARADTCHGEVHIHRYSRAGRERRKSVIRSVIALDDVAAGYDDACDMLIENRELAVRGWARGNR